MRSVLHPGSLQEMTTVDRASVINDAFAFLRAGLLKLDKVFDLVLYVQGEVWQ